LAADGGEAQCWLAERVSWIGAMAPKEGKATAYVCEDYVCLETAVTVGELRARLGQG
jgi:uncharacterized protein YyaL (SSP411 family)